MPSTSSPPGVFAAVRHHWRDLAARDGVIAATRRLVGMFWEFLRNSTPDRLKARFGDAEYDWDYRVNTTSGAVGWRDRLLGIFHSPYQPTDPALFCEMLATLQQHENLNFADFTFVDLGSGKGRTLLMASDYPFRRIVGVELLPSLNNIARQNLTQYKSDLQKCFAIESICGDATEFPLPEDPLIVYLFNPFPESGLHKVAVNLEKSFRANPRPVYVLYHNPQLEHIFITGSAFEKTAGTYQYSIFTAARG